MLSKVKRGSARLRAASKTLAHHVSTQAFPQAFYDSLHEHRRELDALDLQLLSLLAARFAVTGKIGELKARHGAPAADPLREQAQLERLVGLSRELGLRPQVIRAVFETLFLFVRKDHLAHAGAKSE